MELACVNLRQCFGEVYRIEHDPSFFAEHGQQGRAADPWLFIVPARFGHFFPWGGNLLAFSTDGRGETAHKLAALSFATVVQDATDGLTIAFDVKHFDEVARIVRPKHRRKLSEAGKAALIEAGRGARFGSGDGANRSKIERQSTATGGGGPEVVLPNGPGQEAGEISTAIAV